MTIAVIDCGTNTFNLLITEAQQDGWKVIFQNKLPVKLGAGGFEDNEIRPDRFVRGLDALLCHHHNIQNFSCERVFAFATSAIRETTNGGNFVADAKKLTGIDIEVIDGNREAELICDGVRQSMNLGAEASLIMDIGGGSTEFIIANAEEIFWKKSFLLGVSRLFDMVKPDDKLTRANTDQLNRILATELKPLTDALNQFPVTTIIGSSGSFDTLLMLYLNKKHRDEEGTSLHTEIPLKAFENTHQWLMNSTFEERIKHPVIPSIRAEYMPLASYLISYVLRMHPFQHLIHSAYSLKEGAMRAILSRIDWPATPDVSQEKPEDYLEE